MNSPHRPSSFDLVQDRLDDEDTLLAKLESAGAPFGGPAEARGTRVAGPGSPRRNARKGGAMLGKPISDNTRVDNTHVDNTHTQHDQKTLFAGRAQSPLVLPRTDPLRFVGATKVG